MLEIRTSKEMFLHICLIKSYVLKLEMKELQKYKCWFYNQPIPEWQLNLFWEFIFGDIDYIKLATILKSKKLI